MILLKKEKKRSVFTKVNNNLAQGYKIYHEILHYSTYKKDHPAGQGLLATYYGYFHNWSYGHPYRFIKTICPETFDR